MTPEHIEMIMTGHEEVLYMIQSGLTRFKREKTIHQNDYLDIVQDVYLSMLKNPPTESIPCTVSTYIFKHVVWTLASRRRKYAKRMDVQRAMSALRSETPTAYLDDHTLFELEDMADTYMPDKKDVVMKVALGNTLADIARDNNQTRQNIKQFMTRRSTVKLGFVLNGN